MKVVNSKPPGGASRYLLIDLLPDHEQTILNTETLVYTHLLPLKLHLCCVSPGVGKPLESNSLLSPGTGETPPTLAQRSWLVIRRKLNFPTWLLGSAWHFSANALRGANTLSVPFARVESAVVTTTFMKISYIRVLSGCVYGSPQKLESSLRL